MIINVIWVPMNIVLITASSLPYQILAKTSFAALVCLQCQSFKEKVENNDISLTEEHRERARWEWEHAVIEIEAGKSHLLRTFQQDIARQDALNALNSETTLVINDWAMKLLPMKYRETQSEFFGKRGMN